MRGAVRIVILVSIFGLCKPHIRKRVLGKIQVIATYPAWWYRLPSNILSGCPKIRWCQFILRWVTHRNIYFISLFNIYSGTSHLAEASLNRVLTKHKITITQTNTLDQEKIGGQRGTPSTLNVSSVFAFGTDREMKTNSKEKPHCPINKRRCFFSSRKARQPNTFIRQFAN